MFYHLKRAKSFYVSFRKCTKFYNFISNYTKLPVFRVSQIKLIVAKKKRYRYRYRYLSMLLVKTKVYRNDYIFVKKNV